ncbi:MAG: bifunctional metallophosphatase/5'-nucleotidase [Candidatus Promineofilum sp.]|nr:bifunctional metallophosphatase/5'-nucleotidase [Promineifilum sp.]MCW5863148.1 bifunctional metallophosphatase/5'-nucleotidase [Anaerolineae bacterium]
MNVRSLRRFLPLVLVAVAMVLLVLTIGPAAAGPSPEGRMVPIQILAVNDFHGALLPPGTIATPTGNVPAGGAEYLATWIKTLKATNPKTVVVSAGDMIGASPILSALFHDEPSIETFNEIGLDFNAVGNHEFDEGLTELLRMQKGGCHPVDGCADGDPFGGADFRYLAANVFYEGTNRTIFPPYGIRTFSGIKVAFIGMTLEGTPLIVSPSGVAGLEFKDEADTVNRLANLLKKRGVQAIVVLVHEGGFNSVGTEYNACPGISGPIVDIVERTTDEVDLFITGHTHQAYNCVIDGRVVTSAASNGRLVTRINMEVSRKTKDVTSVTAENIIVTQNVAKDPAITALIAKYDAVAAPLRNRIIGSITGDITRAATRGEESSVGRLVADAQLDATNDANNGNAVIAFMNAGGLREDFIYSEITGTEQPGEVTFGEMFQVQPFGNSLVTMDITGAQIETLLEQQWSTQPNPGGKLLQVSEGFTYAYSQSAPIGDKVDPASIKLNGVTIDPNATYRVTVNSFLADGGDGFAVLREGTNRLGGAVDTDALEAYFAAHSPVSPVLTPRITILP